MKQLVGLVLVSFLVLICIGAYGDSEIIIEEESYTSTKNLPEKGIYEEPIDITGIATPFTLRRAEYFTRFIMYGGGGVFLKIGVGIFDILSIGVTEDIDGLIGYGPIRLFIPGGFIKLRLLNHYKGFSLAIGFDAFSFGSISKTDLSKGNINIYGLYISTGYDYWMINSPSTLVIGLRYPILPIDISQLTNISGYIGSWWRISKFLQLNYGIERIYFDIQRLDESVIFGELVFIPISTFSVSVIFQYIPVEGVIGRALRIELKEHF